MVYFSNLVGKTINTINVSLGHPDIKFLRFTSIWLFSKTMRHRAEGVCRVEIRVCEIYD